MSDEKIFAKCAWRLIPLMGLLYAVNLIDRINVGFAALTMNQDLGFSPTVFAFGAGIFSIGFLVFQVPSSIMLERVGAEALDRAHPDGVGRALGSGRAGAGAHELLLCPVSSWASPRRDFSPA